MWKHRHTGETNRKDCNIKMRFIVEIYSGIDARHRGLSVKPRLHYTNLLISHAHNAT